MSPPPVTNEQRRALFQQRLAKIAIIGTLGGMTAALVRERFRDSAELNRLEVEARVDGAALPRDPWLPPADPTPGSYYRAAFTDDEGSEYCQNRDSGALVACMRGGGGVVRERNDAGAITSQSPGAYDSFQVGMPAWFVDGGPDYRFSWAAPCSALAVPQTGGGIGPGCPADRPCRILRESHGGFEAEEGVCYRRPDAGTARPVTPRVYRTCGNPPVPCVCGPDGCTPMGGH